MSAIQLGRVWLLAGGIGIVGLTAGWVAFAEEPQEAADTEREPGPFDEMILEAAGEYEEWERVSNLANWAPALCVAPPLRGASMSESNDGATHGRKLYYLFAKQSDQYTALGGDQVGAAAHDDNNGQIIVKQSWHPVEVDPESVPRLEPHESEAAGQGFRSYPIEYAFDGVKAYKINEQGPLFVMLKLDPATEGTDEGWVYATLTPDGSQVTAVGRIESCMGCHLTANHDRLFGLKRSISP